MTNEICVVCKKGYPTPITNPYHPEYTPKPLNAWHFVGDFALCNECANRMGIKVVVV